MKRHHLFSRFNLQPLESRSVPAQLVVNSIADTDTGTGLTGTFRYCINQANALAGDDTITFDPIVFATPKTIATGGFTLTDKVGVTTIMSSGKNVSLSGSNANRLFTLFSNSSLTLDGLTVTAFKAGFPGGAAINNNGNGTVIVKNCLFTDHYSGDNGGVIFGGGSLTVENSTFENNSGYAGGAISFLGSNCTILNSTFNNNSANSGGGAIWASKAISVVGCQFLNNKASEGGAITLFATSTISNSTFTSNTAASNGGAISGSATILNCSFTNNTSSSGNGGAISGGGTVSNCVFTGNSSRGGGAFSGGGLISDSVFSNNKVTSSGNGGAIRTVTDTTVNNCTIEGNTIATSGAGAGIYNASTLMIANSTINNNTATSGFTPRGGGIASAGTSLSIVNSTVHGNASLRGGGISIETDTVNISISNSTIAGNNGTLEGGGIYRQNGNFTGVITLQSTIVAGNTSDAGPDFYFGAASTVGGNNNLIGVADASNVTFSGTANLIGNTADPLEPQLGPLANNGGPTKTMALLSGSPALNTGSNLLMLAYDQRGFARNVGGNVDIGAIEANSAPQIKSIIVNGGASQRSRVTSISVEFSTLVTLPANPADAFSLIRQKDSQAVALTTSVTNVGFTKVTFTFNGSLSEFGSLADGRYTLTALANSISAAGTMLDGNNDGMPGGDNVLTGSPQNGLFRLFGDSNGDGIVNAVDFASFRSFFGLGASIFDFDNSGGTDAVDFAQFRARFGLMV